MTRILLIGGSGFIGSHIRRLISRVGSGRCTIVSRSVPKLALESHEEWVSSAQFYDHWNNAPNAIFDWDAVVYAATTSIPNRNEQAPWLELENNVRPALEFFERIGQLGAKPRIVVLSSGGTIYGNAGNRQDVAETTPGAPTTAYAFGSALIEQAIQFVQRRHGISFSILRVANPIGEFQGENGHGLVPAILRALRHDVAVPVFGDGQNIRDYFAADDLAQAVLLAARDTSSRSEIWNAGMGKGRSILEMIDLVTKVTGHRARIEFLPERRTDVRRLVLDCSKIHRDLGWTADPDLRRPISAMWQACPRSP